MQVELYAISDVGRKRKNNEDNFLLLDLTARHYWTGTEGPEPPPALHYVPECQNGIVLVAADGLGGEVAGEVASRMAVEKVCEVMAQVAGETDLGEYLRRAAVQSSDAIKLKGQEPDFHRLGSTFTGAALKNGVLQFAQVGDSRAYLLREQELKQITKDQTLVQQLVEIGQLSPANAEKHHYKHVLIQALGTETGVTPAVGLVYLRRGDIVLLCSDGLSNKVTAEVIKQILQSAGTLEKACRQLVDTANANGGEDNITVVLARCQGDDLEAPDGTPVVVKSMNTQGYDDPTTLGKMSYDQLAATGPLADQPANYLRRQ